MTATIDTGQPWVDFIDNIKMVFTDDYNGGNTLELPGTADIYTYDFKTPPRYPCIKIIERTGGPVSPVGSGTTLARVSPSVLIELHVEEMDPSLGYVERGKKLKALIRLFVQSKNDKIWAVNGWGYQVFFSEVTPLRYEDQSGRIISMVGFVLDCESENIDMA